MFYPWAVEKIYFLRHSISDLSSLTTLLSMPDYLVNGRTIPKLVKSSCHICYNSGELVLSRLIWKLNMQMVTKSFVLRQDTRTRIETLEWNSDWEINFATGNYQINILNKELRKFKGNPK